MLMERRESNEVSSPQFIGNVASKELILSEVSKLNWVHSIDLGQGIVTPGRWKDHNANLRRAIGEIDFVGKKVLDIGCWDGLFSFEAERLGADEVFATDYIAHRPDRDQPTFQLAHRVLGSRVNYFPHVSVYDIESLGVFDFDVVIDAGIYYHMKDPLRSFAMLRRVMKDGGVLLVEGAAVAGSEATARFHYRDVCWDDTSNWWIPTSACLREWVECSFFEIENDYHQGIEHQLPQGTPYRHVLTARATRRKDPLYHYPDPDLRQFDLNEY
jgi:tRNA (mo5U34)-methyltransferase